jgi:hypothetical protein
MLFAGNVLKGSVGQTIERLIKISKTGFSRRRKREPNRAPILSTCYLFDEPFLDELFHGPTRPTFIKADAPTQLR